MDVTIRVRGEHEVRLPAERGTVHLRVRQDGPLPGPVLAEVEDAVAEVVAMIGELDVRRHTVDQVRTSAWRPMDDKGRPRPLVHQATVEMTVEFDDFAALGGWLSDLATLPVVHVSWIEWDLTEDRRREVERQVRQEALRQAQRRAQDYADALELGVVQVRTVADTGLMPATRPTEGVLLAGARAVEGSGERPDLAELMKPDDIEIGAEVEAEFVILGP